MEGSLGPSTSVERLLDELASGRPTPGGGAGAAFAGALGASLVAMLARASRGRPRYASQGKLLDAVVEGADEARRRLLDLAAQDAKAYDAVMAARRLPHGTDEREEARREAMQGAVRGATEAPLRIMEQCLEVIGLAKNAIESGNPHAHADGAGGAVICRAAMQAASFGVRANLTEIADEEYGRLCRARLDEMLYMAVRVVTGIESQVAERWT
ncbi:MAG: cyclodeaminase/cyclohydrolase family protein [Planctomycetota bacterium]